MPQIFVLCQFMRDDQLTKLGHHLMPVVEKGFGIEGLCDTAFTGINNVDSINEADIQIEIRYTAGHDEYFHGVPFDPTMDEQKQLAEAIKLAVDEFVMKECGRSDLEISVWCKPFYNSYFQIWKKK